MKKLTKRQKDVLEGIMNGASNMEIAKSLGIAVSTVKTRLKELYKIKGVSTRLELVVKEYKKQVREAKSVIKLYADTTIGYKMKDGTYGILVCSGELSLKNPLQSKSCTNYIHYDPRPAQNYLKKWH